MKRLYLCYLIYTREAIFFKIVFSFTGATLVSVLLIGWSKGVLAQYNKIAVSPKIFIPTTEPAFGRVRNLVHIPYHLEMMISNNNEEGGSDPFIDLRSSSRLRSSSQR